MDFRDCFLKGGFPLWSGGESMVSNPGSDDSWPMIACGFVYCFCSILMAVCLHMTGCFVFLLADN